MATEETNPTSEEAIKNISIALDNCDRDTIEKHLKSLNAAETAHILNALPAADRTRLFECVPEGLDGEVLLHMSEVAAAELAESMDTEALHHATKSMDTADVAELLDEVLDKEAADDLLDNMDAHRRERVELNLSYEEDTAGRLMHTDAIIVRGDVTLETVYRYLQRHDEVPDDTNVLMVVNRDNLFLGALSILKLVLEPAEKLVSEVMDSEWKTLNPDMPESEVIRAFEDHDWFSAPVIDDEGYFLGRIVVDDVVDSMRDQADHAILGSVGLDDDEDLFAPMLPSAGRRTIWLALNLVTAFLASWVIGFYEATIEKFVALAVLMPVVASMGGIAGSQTLTLTIRGLAMGHVVDSNKKSLLKKELGIGVINGLLWATVVAIVAYFWFDEKIAMVIAAALVLNMLAAALAGIVVPLVLHRMNIDPALSGAVILTTVTDVVGFMAFLGLATLFLT
jgi:magnesium transporter